MVRERERERERADKERSIGGGRGRGRQSRTQKVYGRGRMQEGKMCGNRLKETNEAK